MCHLHSHKTISKNNLRPLSEKGTSFDVDIIASSLPSVYQVFMMNGKYGPSLPRSNLNMSNSQNYGPRLPQNINTNTFEPTLPQQAAQKFGPSLPTSTTSEKLGPPLPNNPGASGGMFGPALPVSAHGPVLPATLTNLVQNPDKFGPPLPIQTYPKLAPTLPPTPVFSSFPVNVAAKDADVKFGPPPADAVNDDKTASHAEKDTTLPPVPENCHTTIERLLQLYIVDPEVLGSKTNLQDVFGGSARGFDPADEDTEPKIISQSLELPPKKENPPEDPPSKEPAAVANVLEPILKAYIGSFQPPKFSSFPSDVVDAVIKGKPDKKESKTDQKGVYPEKRAHSPRHRHNSPSRQRHRSSPRQKSPQRPKSPLHHRSPPRHRSPRREKSPHRRRSRSPHRDRRHSPHRRHSPSRSDKSFDRSRSDSGRQADRERAPDKQSPIFPPKAPQSMGSSMGPPIPNPNILSPTNMQQNRFGPPIPPNNLLPQQDRFGPPMPQPGNIHSGRFGPPVPPNNMQPDRFGPPVPPNNMQPDRFGPPAPANNMGTNRFGPPVPPNNMQQNRFGPPVPPNNMQQNRFGPPVPPNNMPMPMGNMQGSNNFNHFQPMGNNFRPAMNQNFPQGPRMGNPGLMNMGQPRGFSPPPRMMQPGPYRPRGM